MKTLVLYGTVEGHTLKVAKFVGHELRKLGHEVLVRSADEAIKADFEGVDSVVLAASVHQRRHPKTFEASLVAFANELAARKTLLLSVSLSAAFPEGMEEAQDYLTEMEMRTKFKPDAEMLVAGALRTAEYDFFALQVIRHVVLRGRGFDPSAGDHEFTDWDALEAGIKSFAEELEGV